MAAYTGQGFEPFGCVALKATGLIHHHHVKRPAVPVVVYQPADIFPVDDVDVRRCVQRPDAFCLAAKHGRHPEDLRMVPFLLFLRPGAFCHFLRGNHQYPSDSKAVIFQFPDGSKGGDSFPQALTHIQK